MNNNSAYTILYGVSFYKKYKRNEKVKVLEENYSNLQKRTTKLYNSIKNNFIPDRFASLMAVNYMYEAVKNGQADTFKEALIRCEEELRYQNTVSEMKKYNHCNIRQFVPPIARLTQQELLLMNLKNECKTFLRLDFSYK